LIDSSMPSEQLHYNK